MLIQKLADKKLLNIPSWVRTNTNFEAIVGSNAYATNNEDSDWDIFAIVTPPKSFIFPHLSGFIPGFGTPPPQFKPIKKHHVFDKEEGKEYDVEMTDIIKIFELARLGNPNIIGNLFVPDNCILHITEIGTLIRENRKEFLSKFCWPRFKGYAYGMMKKMKNKKPEGDRIALVEKYGYDTKFAMNLVRLLSEVEQILLHEDLDLQLNKEQHKAIRHGEWPEQDIYDYFHSKEKSLEKVYLNSKLRVKPNEAKLKQLLIDCLEIQYQDIKNIVTMPEESVNALRSIDEILSQLKKRGAI